MTHAGRRACRCRQRLCCWLWHVLMTLLLCDECCCDVWMVCVCANSAESRVFEAVAAEMAEINTKNMLRTSGTGVMHTERL